MTKYSLIVKLKNKDKGSADFETFSPNYHSIKLGKFEEHPDMIGGICEEFQRSIKNGESSVK